MAESMLTLLLHTLHGQLSRAILSGMYSCSFEIVLDRLVLKKFENEIWAIHLHNHLLSDSLRKI